MNPHEFKDYIILAGPYTLSEIHMMTPVIDDLRRLGTQYKTMDTEKGTLILRHKNGYKHLED